jgi:hypothetical protein
MSKPLHDAYCFASGFEIKPTIAHQRAWFEFEKAGFNVEDLRLVIKYLKREISRGNRRDGSLKFSNLIGLGETAADRANFFAEDLALARQAFRTPAPTTAMQTQKTGDITRTVEVLVSADPVKIDRDMTDPFIQELERRKAHRAAKGTKQQ